MSLRDVEMAVAALDRPRRVDPHHTGRQAVANKLTLRGHHIEVDHMIGGNPSVTAMSYQKGSFSKTFKPGEIHADPGRPRLARFGGAGEDHRYRRRALPRSFCRRSTFRKVKPLISPRSPSSSTSAGRIRSRIARRRGRLSCLRVRHKPCWCRSSRESGLRRLPGAPVQMFRRRRRRWRLRFPRSATSSSLIGATLPSIPSIRHDMVMRCRAGGRRFTARGHLACRPSTCSR
jgi:hypothetical protein